VLRPCAPWTVAWPAAGVSMRNHVACTGCPGAPALQAPCSRLSGGLAARAVPHVPGHRDLHVARAHQLGAVLVPGRHLARPRPGPGGWGARRDAVLPVVHMTAQRSCPGTWHGPAWRRCWPGDARPAARRSLGLTLLECATGRYPYDASGGPLQLMIQARRARIDGLICWLPGELPLLRRAAALRSDAPQTLRPPSTSLAAKLGAADAPRAPRRMQCLASQFQWPWLGCTGAQVVEEAVPLPAPGACSSEFRDFVAACMQKDPLRRPSAEGLLSHAFILKARGAPHRRCRPASHARAVRPRASLPGHAAPAAAAAPLHRVPALCLHACLTGRPRARAACAEALRPAPVPAQPRQP